ncbi:excinuclease ABC subunit UvrC [Candidatus Poribacteria bacterium]|nr:excinuclease ABC subunit UvrC [Candidatus Poribacteria bacterium]
MNNIISTKKNLISNIPNLPGVYIMKNVSGDVIYVGKAIFLKKRLQSYFNRPNDTKTSHLVYDIETIDYLITDNEIEALILECNLIKKYKPKYNIELKDDKKYPYIKITSEEYPRMFISRDVRKDGATYFGPYTNVKLLRENVKFIRNVFPIRTCKSFRSKRACLNYHIKKCPAPCEKKISAEEYKKNIFDIELFLYGKTDELISGLKEKMLKLSNEMQYEAASSVRDRINAIEAVFEKQKVDLGTTNDEDAIAQVQEAGITCITVFFFREGKLNGERHFFINRPEMTSNEIMTEFIKQFYSLPTDFIPGNILLSHKLNEEELLITWLTKKRGSKVNIILPKRGEKLSRIEMVMRNAENFLKVEIEKQKRKNRESEELLQITKNNLDLKNIPLRIEAFDISNISGTESVGSMVVFVNGVLYKKHYRRFKIKEVKGIDDYAMMQEVIKRRYTGTLKDILPLPDLILIDGGLGQLNAALKELIKTDLSYPDIRSLAKKYEEIYSPNDDIPLKLPDDSPVLFLLQNIRDEAHRFALKYHKLLRNKRIFNEKAQ